MRIVDHVVLMFVNAYLTFGLPRRACLRAVSYTQSMQVQVRTRRLAGPTPDTQTAAHATTLVSRTVEKRES